MANLLPEKYGSTVRHELSRRFALIACLFILLASFFQLIFFSVSYFWLDSYEKGLKKEFEVTKMIAKKQNIDVIEAETSGLNDLALDFQKGYEKKNAAVSHIWSIVGSLLPSVKLRSFYLDMTKDIPRINISGHASTRRDLMIFIEKLKENQNFKEISSPASNLLTLKDVDFSVIITLNKDE